MHLLEHILGNWGYRPKLIPTTTQVLQSVYIKLFIKNKNKINLLVSHVSDPTHEI